MGRDPKHNYKSRCIYHITIGKASACPVFSQIGGSPEQPLVIRSRLGEIIESQILNFPNLCPFLQPLQYVIMPDHIHFILFARDYLPRVLGRYIGMMSWKHLAENGGILVSPFISPAKKAIRSQCEEAGGKIILISNIPFSERGKPAAHDFDFCSKGSLLILAPMSPLPACRSTFLYLNSVAESISIPH